MYEGYEKNVSSKAKEISLVGKDLFRSSEPSIYFYLEILVIENNIIW